MTLSYFKKRESISQMKKIIISKKIITTFTTFINKKTKNKKQKRRELLPLSYPILSYSISSSRHD